MTRTILANLFLLPLLCGVMFASEGMIVLFDAEKGGEVTGQGATTELKDGELFVTTARDHSSPGFSLRGNWQIPENSEMLLVITNRDERPLYVTCRLESPGTSDNGRNRSVSSGVTIWPGETVNWRFKIPIKVPEFFNGKFSGMTGGPFGSTRGSDNAFNPKNISQLTMSMVPRGGVESYYSVKLIAASPVEPPTDLLSIPEDKFFPMVDKYGQFMHRDWLGKIHSDADLKKALEEELADLAANPSPKDRSQYGGWTAGPKLRATGHFRTEKIDGKWWLVDPEGYLFWSHGICRVDYNIATTATTDREFLFAELPPNEGLFAPCFGTSRSGMGYYANRGQFQTFDFSMANLICKYGANWQATYNDLVHKRLRSWGMNTLANYSSSQFYAMRQTPYTLNLGVRARPIQGSQGWWGQFGDPFDPQFRESIRASARQAARNSGQDPWCIGYFVQNEISWGSEISLAVASFTSPADQPAKIALVEHLRKKYEDIAKLNAVWQSNYESWDDMLQSTQRPNDQYAREDLIECYRLIAECYFRTISEELKAACPDKLYLGCRFMIRNHVVTSVAAKYCDVVSFNEYRTDLNNFILPDDFDKPAIIGEFHFCAPDRGMFDVGHRRVNTQEERAAAYEKFVKSALDSPFFVGTHWWLYMDQAVTGRPLDNESYPSGMLTSVDSPHQELIEAARRIGALMYVSRYRGECDQLLAE